MEKIALISDIHGNLEALKAVLEDIKKREIKHIYCLGDIIAKGCNSEACVKLVKENCEIVVMGNCDYFFSKQRDFYIMSEVEKSRDIWNKQQLSKESIEFLKQLPFTYEFYMSGSLIRIFHATPYDIECAIISQETQEKLYEMFLPTDKTISNKKADIVIFGHLHHPFMEKLYGRTLINVGSIGNSYDPIRNVQKDAHQMEITQAFYCIIEGEIGSQEYSPFSYQLVRVPYNIQKEIESNIGKNIEFESYKYELENGKYRHMNRINSNFKRLGIDVTKF